MVEQARVVAYHGWGFDASCWAGWKGRFEAENMSFSAFDRGYFGQAYTPSVDDLRSEQPLIVLAHSYGLHLCPAEVLQRATWLVIFSSFQEFHPSAEREQRRSQRVLNQMIQRYQEDPETVLNTFHTNCGSPHVENQQMNRSDHELLLQDLMHMNTNHLNLDPFALIPQIMILHGVKDAIVPISQGQELFKQCNQLTHFVEHEEAGHALPFSHLEDCWNTFSKMRSLILN
ncbi:hypothetical protein ACQ4M4_09645 [Leptolyngbya sp. AN02str]|uniref:alpha/beta fold hydrolase n=1 Tax=Leptolyngbya sp. AN02str TaxID=3423363 RepID=UPI003D31629D